jgi:hypothetical protein
MATLILYLNTQGDSVFFTAKLEEADEVVIWSSKCKQTVV